MGKTKGLRQRVLAIAGDLGLSSADVAQHTDLATSTVGRYLAGTLAETVRIADEMKLFLARIERGEIRGAKKVDVVSISAGPSKRRKRSPQARQRRTYETNMMKRVWSAMDLCVENGSIGLITADFGAGKTAAAQAWRATRDVDSVYIEFNQLTAASKYDLITFVASSLGLGDRRATNGSAARIYNDIVARLREQPTVLIFDQCECARVKTLQVIRQLWDQTREAGVSVILLSAAALLRRLELSARSDDVGALRSRIGVWVPLRGVERDAMATILQAEGLTNVSEKAFDLWFRAIGGSMRYLMGSIDLLVARHRGKPIGVKTILGVCESLMGLSIPGGAGGGPEC